MPRGQEDLTRFEYNKSVLVYVATDRENKKNGPDTVNIIHLCFHRPSETTSKAMKKLIEIEIQTTQVKNCLALKSFRDVLSNKRHIKCSQSDITSGLNSFETDKKCPFLHKIMIPSQCIIYLAGNAINEGQNHTARVAIGQDTELQSRFVVANYD